MELTEGQELALLQLAEIVARSNGTLEIVGQPRRDEGKGHINVELSLAARHYRRPEGLAFRDRERLRLLVHDNFPFQYPWLYFAHRRFVGAPHVQWGSYICLYQSSETEWRASDGMFGFMERVHQWFAAAGAGTLDPEDAPLHPPVAYTSSPTKFVMKENTPSLGGIGGVWLGRAELNKVRANRFDTIGWTPVAEWDEPPIGTDVAGAILLAEPLPLEYPSTFYDLFRALERVGVSLKLLIQLLKLAALMADEGAPSYIVLGAPMRRKAAGEPLRQHLTVWEIDTEALAKLRAYALDKTDSTETLDTVIEWMASAKIAWCPVLEARSEILNRRDSGSPTAWLLNKRVLLLGCGALGSAIAEQVVRAGAAALELVDYGTVKPGLLVRQRYADSDIGRAKVDALRERLDALGFSCTLTVNKSNLKTAALGLFDLTQWDLVIDATASTGVSHTIEREVGVSAQNIPLVSLAISAGAEYGSVSVRTPNYVGGPIQIAREAKLAFFERDQQHPAVQAFWPKPLQIKLFQPEPGCSDPTFTGSAADLDHHAGGLLNCALRHVATLRKRHASMDLTTAPWVVGSAAQSGRISQTFKSRQHSRERNHRYQVVLSAIAEKGVRAELARIGRVRTSKIETGGLMFGEIDDAHRRIWIDSVSGPPPDSEASEEKFLCGTAGAADLARHKNAVSGGSSRFIGIWHTHPVSRGSPSNEDLKAMAELLFLQPFPPRQVAMLIVGFAESKPQLNYYLYHRSDFTIFRREHAGPGSAGE